HVSASQNGSQRPEHLVMVPGHLDSWGWATCAIDAAAGVAVAMETAALIQRLHMRPTRTLRVIAWMDEENGGRGHDAYAKMHANEFANYAAVMESDLGARSEEHTSELQSRVDIVCRLLREKKKKYRKKRRQ